MELLVAMSKKQEAIIQKADNGNIVVILDNKYYVEKKKQLLNDTSKFARLEIRQTKKFCRFEHSKVVM